MPTTLLYLASGKYLSEYENLPFDKVILVDRSIRRSDKVPSDSKVTLIAGDALPGIRRLKQEKELKKLRHALLTLKGVSAGSYEDRFDVKQRDKKE